MLGMPPPRSKGANVPRPLNEIYIAVPSAFHEAHPDFFVRDISKVMEKKKSAPRGSREGEISFRIHLTKWQSFPGRLTQDGFKAFQSGSNNERDEQGKLTVRMPWDNGCWSTFSTCEKGKPVTRHWLWEKGTMPFDSGGTQTTMFSPELVLRSIERFMKGMDANAEENGMNHD